ncbi:MAG: hypothetical protein IKE12_01830 [Erysipelotrichaceae bacterium]|nr:hypothetical protein [Erysipelotrichaceae bacterium]MBR2791386.1 hypothetical protein [Erysipelotrichaceae bacterium]MBR3350911.1 hypothetical protein [Erysipelotrichaceae bacterium]MBR6956817.1 hypothetical protein [Erysipelotrichaceae bacterium]
MRKILTALLCLIMVMNMMGCTEREKQPEQETVIPDSEQETGSDSQEASEVEKVLCLYVNDRKLPVTWEDNDSVAEIRSIVNNDSLTVEMSMYGDFEQVGELGRNITRNDRQMTTSYGDIVLYSGSNIVIFYGSNSWSYTKLGHVDLSQQEMTDLLGNGDIRITLTME